MLITMGDVLDDSQIEIGSWSFSQFDQQLKKTCVTLFIWNMENGFVNWNEHIITMWVFTFR